MRRSRSTLHARKARPGWPSLAQSVPDTFHKTGLYVNFPPFAFVGLLFSPLRPFSPRPPRLLLPGSPRTGRKKQQPDHTSLRVKFKGEAKFREAQIFVTGVRV